MRSCLMLALAALLAACEKPDPAELAGSPGPSAEEPAPGRRDAAPPPPDAPPPEAPEQCGAGDYQWLVGRPRSAVPDKPTGATWRIACSECPVTMDYSPSRMNIIYDEESGIVEAVDCG